MYYWLDISIYIGIICLVIYTSYQSKQTGKKLIKWIDWSLKLLLMTMTSLTILMLLTKFDVFEKIIEYGSLYYINDSEIFRR